MAQTPVRRGRHRRPRPRRVVFAVGGLALAAGALSLVRAGHEPGAGGAGRAEAEPRQDAGQGAGTDRSGNAVATVEAVPRVSPSATSVMGRTGATPASGLVPLPGGTASPGSAPAVTTTATAPQEPNAPSPTTTPNPPPRPTTPPTTGRSAPPPPQSSPQPPRRTHTPAPPALCVPVIGLCVGPLAD